MAMESTFIIHEANATRYEIVVNYVDNKDSDYDTQFVVSLVNFGECFFESCLNHIATAIVRKSNILSPLDARNIQNAIAESNLFNVSKVKFDENSKQFALA